jgi:hypothetical protein
MSLKPDVTDSDHITVSPYDGLPGLAVAMMWVLIVLGSLVCVGGILLHFVIGESSQTVRITTNPGGSAGAKVVTTVSTSPSDALLIAIVGIGAVLVVAGAFFPRISSITFPGGGKISLEAIRTLAKKAVDTAAQKRGATPTDEQVAAAIDYATVKLAQNLPASARWVNLRRRYAQVTEAPPDLDSLGEEALEFSTKRDLAGTPESKP